MKRKLWSSISLTFLLFFCTATFAQGNKSVFLEIFGNGIGFSANYDMRFAKKENGFGFRAGIGIYPETFVNSSFITLPIGINHLAGKAPHHLETGLGVTFIPGGIEAFGEDEIAVNGIMFVPSIGYRYARKTRGFQGRIFFSPWIGEDFVAVGGFSLGYKF